MPVKNAPRRGYLNEDIRLFFLRDQKMAQVDWHYHSFHKLLFFLSGRGSYAIEGQSYALEPGDMLLIPKGAIHRPEIQPDRPYERYVLYISPELLRRASCEGTDLEQCFRLAQNGYQFALRPGRETVFLRLLEQLRQAQETEGFGRELLEQAIVIQLLVSITRDLEDHQLRYVTSAACDEKIVSILKYLNLHLHQTMTIDELAKQFYMSKYYMMRRFRAETGYTIHGYLTEKRLLLARERIAQGDTLSRISEDCGFGDYSTFSRAYKRRFGVSPSTPVEKAPGEEEPLD